ncbi:hypothetical protein BH11MYX1_BH11MYX1_06380 [soil metagenome]
MKFLCDRCKTRYSIGDDRVRGKILKIRCKNCANVITVREGMSVDDSAPSDRGRPTTAAPMAAAAGGGGALASAFASQLAKPPPALEEEWYVSIDGDQSGPYSLSDAQRWIASKPVDADVHCWSEGFDDWLPVDKVSHFRGLRKRATPPAAPPLPRAVPGRSGPVARPTPQPHAAPVEDEPKPLFAATMAALEKDAGVPPSARTPVNGIVTKANGTGSKPIPKAVIPTITGPGSPVAPINKNGTGSTRSSTVQGLGGQQSAGAKALTAAFETSEKMPAPAGESMTTVDTAYRDDGVNAEEPSAAKRAFGGALDARAAEQAVEPSNGTPEAPDFDDDSMEIGEVSRVVKLADLAKMANQPRKSRAPVANPIALRATGSAPKIDAASLAMADAATAAAPDAPIEPAAAAPIVAQVHRRGLIMLIGIAAVLLIGVAALVIIMVQKNGEDTLGGLGSKRQIDTSRPDELVFHTGPLYQGSAAVLKPNIPHINRPNLPRFGSGDDSGSGEAKGDKLKGEEIEAMANKNATGTQRCYMRAQRGAEGIEIADLKKLSVTLNIDRTGTVTDVTLSDHGTDSLGTCLIGQVKRWKFRESPGGLVRITLAFAQ